jgi:ABC-type cobalt transport system substrate-binding protein
VIVLFAIEAMMGATLIWYFVWCWREWRRLKRMDLM